MNENDQQKSPISKTSGHHESFGDKVMSVASDNDHRDILSPIPGFKSLETHHCITGSMLHIYTFNDCPVSEEMLLGLGSGVGFIYWHQKGTDPFIGGRANFERPGEQGLEITVSRRLGVKARSFYTSSARKAEKTLLEMLQSGQPVMLQVDMGYLPYFDFGGVEYHFGYHVIVVAGYDPKTRQVLVADRDYDLHPVSWEALARARGSTYKPFPPKHHWYTYDFSGFHPPHPADVVISIQEAAKGMLEPPISNFGVKGIRKTAQRVSRWPDNLDSDALRRTCFNAFIFIDAKGGTGGGLFRYMYGRFLKEAAEITAIDSLGEMGEAFDVIGDRWQDMAAVFRCASENENPGAVLAETTGLLLAIADMEQVVWERLVEIVR
jgi:hypothetical protein